MDSALIISNSEKNIAQIKELLGVAMINQIVAVTSCAEARRMLLDREFGLVLIISPLKDETGELLSIDIASKGLSQVILVVDSEYYDEMSANTENDGVLTLKKPLSKSVLWATLKLARAAQNRFLKVQKENTKLKQRISDIKVVDRAKYILYSYYKMSEEEAHRYIEKQAMDMRVTRREIAENILKTYEN